MHGYFIGNKATQCVLDTGCFSNKEEDNATEI